MAFGGHPVHLFGSPSTAGTINLDRSGLYSAVNKLQIFPNLSFSSSVFLFFPFLSALPLRRRNGSSLCLGDMTHHCRPAAQLAAEHRAGVQAGRGPQAQRSGWFSKEEGNAGCFSGRMLAAPALWSSTPAASGLFAASLRPPPITDQSHSDSSRHPSTQGSAVDFLNILLWLITVLQSTLFGSRG